MSDSGEGGGGRAGLDILKKRMVAPGHPIHSLVTLPTEVSQFHDPDSGFLKSAGQSVFLSLRSFELFFWGGGLKIGGSCVKIYMF